MQSRVTPAISPSSEEIQILLKYFPKGICAFDLEMTGLSPLLDKIIEIAAVKLNPDGSLESFHELINPLIPIPEHTIQYHGLTNEDLRDKPSLKTPLKQFYQFYGDIPLLAHNAMFDASFLIRGLHEYHLPIGLSSIYDSCKFARNIFKKKKNGPKDFKLSTLAEYYNFSFNHHQAMDDALVALKIFAQLLLLFKKDDAPKESIRISFLFKLNSFKKPESYLLPNKLKPLEQAFGKKKIYIKYKGGSFKGKLRPIRPISLLPMPQGLILYAECLHTQMNKYFKIEKIQAVKLENDTNKKA